jgi:hypothetical protein
VLPANVSGEWTFPAGNLPHTLRIDQLYQDVSGTMEVSGNSRAIEDMQISGDRLTFSVSVERETGTVVYRYEGTVSGDTINGTITSGQAVNEWKAIRTPKTAGSIITEIFSGQY